MIHWYWLILICPASASLGFIAAAILSAASRADDLAEKYGPVENDPEPRVSTQIFDGLAKRKPTT